MATWANLITLTEKLIDDSGGVFHTATEIQRYLEHGELMIAVLRGGSGVEQTGDLTLSSGTPLYTIHNTFSDFIYPVRVRIGNIVLPPTSFANVIRLHSSWYTDTSSQPDSFFMIGATMMGFYKGPNTTMTAKVTYIRIPTTGAATTASPLIDTEYQDFMPYYAAAILMGKEGEAIVAQELFQRFSELAGIPRDPRFMPGATQEGESQTQSPTVGVG